MNELTNDVEMIVFFPLKHKAMITAVITANQVPYN